MGLIKDALVGAICMSVGYCIGATRHDYAPQHAVAQQRFVHEEQRANNLDALIDFVQTYTPSQRRQHQHQRQKESLSISEIWQSLPPVLQKKIIEASKEAVEQQVKDSYHALKDQSSSMYDEMKHFIYKKLNGEGN